MTLSSSQISNIEKSINTPSSDKLIHLLSMLNTTYEEFLLFLDDDYSICKKLLQERFIEQGNLGNIKELEKLATDSQRMYIDYNDIYFKYLELQSLAAIELYKNNFDFAKAKPYTTPIKNYLGKVENWGQYEVSLFSNCLFMFEVNDVISFENRVLDTLENNFDTYKSKDSMCILLNNLAAYTLDYREFYNRSLKYALLSEEYASFSQNTTQIIRAKILQQIVYYKFNNQKLVSFLQVFQLTELENLYKNTYQFITKHGIDL